MLNVAELRARPSAPARETTNGLSFKGITKRFGSSKSARTVLDNVDLVVQEGQFVTLIGPSGCGKSTLLRIAAGLLKPESGEVTIYGDSVSQAAQKKEIGFVSQQPALMPWRTVRQNVSLPMQVNKGADLSKRALRSPEEILAMVGLTDHLDKRPGQLSGGMQQRVAIARAFSFEPSLLLMDEPFAALDEFTREVLRAELVRMWEADKKTVLFVTHSVAEAVQLSDVVAVMSSEGTIRSLVPIDLPRPRGDAVDMTDEFFQVEREIRAKLREGWRHGGNS